MGRVRCAVLGCEDMKSPRHCFPDFLKEPEVFGKWLQACKNPELNEMDPALIKKRKMVCAKHFTESCRMNRNLFRGSVPTLFLPSTVGDGNANEEPIVAVKEEKALIIYIGCSKHEVIE